MRKKPKKKPLRPIHVRVKKLREERRLTQSQLAEKCGVDKSAVSHWENGASSPTGNRLHIVAEALGVAVSDLFLVEAA